MKCFLKNYYYFYIAHCGSIDVPYSTTLVCTPTNIGGPAGAGASMWALTSSNLFIDPSVVKGNLILVARPFYLPLSPVWSSRTQAEMAAVRGVLLDESVLLSDDGDDGPLLKPGAEAVLRRLRYSDLRVVWYLSEGTHFLVGYLVPEQWFTENFLLPYELWVCIWGNSASFF